MTTLRVEQLTLPGARLGEENPLPFFRDPQVDYPVKLLPSVPPEKRAGFGAQAGFRVLPYRMQDDYGRAREPLALRAIVLENEHLAATFLPELGGRLYSLVSKPRGRELLSRNPVFQPANLALRNAWFSGGVEWNIGQFGHTFGTCAPLFAAAIAGPGGEPGLRLYEFERCKRLFWQLDVYLPPDSPVLLAYARVVNPNHDDTSMYWWTNIAVPEAPGVRVLAPANTALYLDSSFQDLGFSAAELPQLPSLPGRDATYSLNFPFANEFFFQCDTADLPWEAALDAQGTGMFEASTARMKYRKLFCWGTHQGGQRWQEFLSVPGQPYIEIQAGLAPTQLHSQPMPAGAAWDWMQAFGFLEADPALIHGDNWPAAWQAADRAIKQIIAPGRLAELETACRERADVPAGELLHFGSGWGALELRRRAETPGARPVPAAFVFPESTLGAEQVPWVELLRTGRLAERDPAAPPDAWMTQPEWEALLNASLEQPELRNWHALLHAGVMRMERFDENGAEAAWQASIDHTPTAWAFRNLAQLALRRGRQQQALAYYAQAWQHAADNPPAALAQEYLQALCAAGKFEQALAAYQQVSPAGQARDRVRIARARIAMGLGDLDTVEQALRHEYADIREGETELTDMWFELWSRRLAAQTGRPLDEQLRREAEQRHPPPLAIDYRMKHT